MSSLERVPDYRGFSLERFQITEDSVLRGLAAPV